MDFRLALGGLDSLAVLALPTLALLGLLPLGPASFYAIRSRLEEKHDKD
jgi:hypothetical protein